MRRGLKFVLLVIALLAFTIGYYVRSVILRMPQLQAIQLCSDISAVSDVDFTLPISHTFWIALGYDNVDYVPEIIRGKLQVFDARDTLLNEYTLNISGYMRKSNWLSAHGLECAIFRVEELDAYPREEKYRFQIHVDENPRMSLWLHSITSGYYQRKYRKSKIEVIVVSPERATGNSVGQRPTFGVNKILSPERAWAFKACALTGLENVYAHFRRALPYAIAFRPFRAEKRSNIKLNHYNVQTTEIDLNRLIRLKSILVETRN